MCSTSFQENKFRKKLNLLLKLYDIVLSVLINCSLKKVSNWCVLLISLKESNKVEEEDTKLDIYLMNGKKFQVNVRNTDSTDHVMQVAGQACLFIQNSKAVIQLFKSGSGMAPKHNTSMVPSSQIRVLHAIRMLHCLFIVLKITLLLMPSGC